MPTLNGVPFNIIKKRTTVINNNIVRALPASDETIIKHNGYTTEPMVITGFVYNDKEFDDFKEQFYSDEDLTLIVEEDSGTQYTVRGSQGVYELDGEEVEGHNITFIAYFELKNPYKESVVTLTRSKTITENNQEFSTDDSGIDIKTVGNVDATPDIKITGGSIPFGSAQLAVDSNYNLNNSLSTVTISQTNSSMQEDVNSTTVQGQSMNLRKAGMGIIDSIEIVVKGVATSGDVTCTVYSKFGGTALGSKTINIAGTGAKVFTFDTPIAVVQAETTCLDTDDGNYLYWEISTAAADIDIGYSNDFDPYTDGFWYENLVRQGLFDLAFEVVGHSIKEIRQTFEVDENMRLNHILLNMCKYKYTGSNDCTVVVKDGATTLGTSVVVLTGSDFVDVPFYLTETIVGSSLNLVPSTVYTIYITPPSDSGNTTGVLIKTKSTNEYADGAVTLVEDGGTTRVQNHDLYFIAASYYTNDDVQVYNTADVDTKCLVSNEMFHSAVHRVNTDGTGTIDIVDVFTTTNFFRNIHTHNGVERVYSSSTGWGMWVGDTHYATYKIDAKYPLRTIPVLTAFINVYFGSPKIQISVDNSTWYNIDTNIVNEVSTEYPLNSTGNLSLLGKTSFYYRYYGDGAGLVNAGALAMDIHTIYVKNPLIFKSGAANTVRCDQHNDSGMTCTVDLMFKNKWWA